MNEHRQPDADPDRGPSTLRDPWLATASGEPWFILRPRAEDVRIMDIAAGLSRTCRYSGQLLEEFEFLSVAEHSVQMTDWAIEKGLVKTREDALAILFHDASEAYLGDVITPLKALMPDFRRIEDLNQDAVNAGFGLTGDAVTIRKDQIKLIDRRIRLDERAVAIAEPARSNAMDMTWKEDPLLRGLGIPVPGLEPRDARELFVRTFIRIVENMPLRNPDLEQIHRPHLEQAHELLKRLIDAKNKPRVLKNMDIDMAFPVSDPFDNIDQETLRYAGLVALKRINHHRSEFLRTCSQREHLTDLDEDARRTAFGAHVMGAMILSNAKILPGADPASFLGMLGRIDQPIEKKQGLVARILGHSQNLPDPAVKERMIPVLACWPDFDEAAFRSGEPQSEEFIGEFSIDFAGIREMAFESRKVFTLMLEAETHISELTPIYDRFQNAAFAGIDAERLEAYLLRDEPAARPDHEANIPCHS